MISKSLLLATLLVSVLSLFSACSSPEATPSKIMTKKVPSTIKKDVKLIKKVPQKKHFDVVAQNSYYAPGTMFFTNGDANLITGNYGKWSLWDMKSAKLVYNEVSDANDIQVAPNSKYWIYQNNSGGWKNKKYHVYYKDMTKNSMIPICKGEVEITNIAGNIARPYIRIAPNSKYVALISKDAKAFSAVIDVETKKLLWKKKLGFKSYIQDVKISPDGTQLYAYSYAHYSKKKPYYETKIFDLKSGKFISSSASKTYYKKLFEIGMARDYQTSWTYRRNGHTHTFKNTWKKKKPYIVYEKDGKKIWQSKESFYGRVASMTDDTKSVAVSNTKIVKLFDINTGVVLNNLSSETSDMGYVQNAQDRFIVGSNGMILDLKHLKPRKNFEGKDPVLVNDGKYLMYHREVMKRGRRIGTTEHLYDINKEKEVVKLPSNAHAVGGERDQLILGVDLIHGNIYVYDTDTLKIRSKFYHKDLYKSSKYGVRDYYQNKFHLDEKGHYAIVGFRYKGNSKDYRRYLFDIKNKKKILAFRKDELFLGFSRHSKHIYVRNSKTHQVFSYNIALAKVDNKLKINNEIPRKVIAHTTDDKFWLFTNAGPVRLVNAKTMQVEKVLNNTKSVVNTYLSRDKKHFYTRRYYTFEMRKLSDGSVVQSMNTKIFGLSADSYATNALCKKCFYVTFMDGMEYLINMNSFTNIYKQGQGKVLGYSGDENDWIAITPDNYFSASANGIKYVAMRDGLKGYGIDQLALSNNRPDIIMQRLGKCDAKQIAYYKRRYEKRLKKSGVDVSVSSTPPVVSITHMQVNKDNVQLTFDAKTQESSLSEYTLFVNDVPLQRGKLEGSSVSQTLDFSLSTIKNKIEISVNNKLGMESLRDVKVAYLQRPKKGDLYYLGFGVSEYQDRSLNLNYAHKDALDLEKAFKKSAKRGGYNKIYTSVLTDANVTRTEIQKASTFLAQAKAEDTVVIFVAGHGVHDSEGTYYYVTHDANVKDLKNSAASFEVIESLLADTQARQKLFLMDTCESGELDEEVEGRLFASASSRGLKARTTRGLKKKSIKKHTPSPWVLERDRFIYADLNRRTGAIVFSSSRGGEFSYESEKIKNGYFTKAIVSALSSKKADSNKDGYVSTNELRSFVAKKVSRDTKKMQNPTVDRDNLEVSFGFKL